MEYGRIEKIAHEMPSCVQVWRVDLDTYPPVISNGITADETARAARQAHADDRRRHLAARHALRRVLARVTGRAADSLVFATDGFGKPHLVDAENLEFNLSHSAQECLIGISSGRPIGVDVEVLRPVVDAEALSRSHFAETERTEWLRVPVESRDKSFLACWTRKEACLKAFGVGLSAPPAIIAVGVETGLRTVEVPVGSGRCKASLCSVPMVGDAVAAVAIVDAADAAAARAFFARA